MDANYTIFCCRLTTVAADHSPCRRLWLLLPWLALASACAGWQAQPQRYLQAGDEMAACARFYESFDRAVAQAGVADVQTMRITGFPYLRVNRLLASFRGELTPAQEAVWMDQLRELAAVAEAVELTNLPTAQLAMLGVADRAAATTRLDECAARLRKFDQKHPAVMVKLRETARVEDAYHDFQRLLGLYPLTALAVSAGIQDLSAATRERFAADDWPVTGQLVDYVPTGQRPDAVTGIRRGALGIPQPTPTQRRRLFDRHAPIWRVDVASPADRIGRPAWRQGRIVIDTTQPVVYEKLSYTRWQDQVLLQLNYVIWFPARSKTGPLDLYGGHLDGITWRVTLAPDGSVLLYDAMHNCGCYHMAFPGSRIVPRDVGGLWQEPLITPADAPVLAANERVRIRLVAASHYLQSISAVAMPADGIEYHLVAYRQLRSLPLADGQHRSLFDEQGLVPGTQRLERWLLWPMGVAEPGAMRQWGQHATAFVGKRHFDDPDLLRRYFEVR